MPVTEQQFFKPQIRVLRDLSCSISQLVVVVVVVVIVVCRSRSSSSRGIQKIQRKGMSIQQYLVHISYVVCRRGPAVVHCWTAWRPAAARHCMHDAHNWRTSPSRQSSAADVSEGPCEWLPAHSFNRQCHRYTTSSNHNNSINHNNATNHNHNIFNFI